MVEDAARGLREAELSQTQAPVNAKPQRPYGSRTQAYRHPRNGVHWPAATYGARRGISAEAAALQAAPPLDERATVKCPAMREALKVLCVVVFMFATPAAAVAWTDPQPTLTVWMVRCACPVLSILSIAGFLKIHFRLDKAPDYLRQQFGTYFNRGGLCFDLQATAAGGVCYLDVYFQNQQDQPCLARIAIRPARGFFLNRANLDTIAIEIHCEPAAYGVARVAIPVPANLQGKRQSFEVGASVEYPQGKGKTLRFHDGIVFRTNSSFGDAFGTGLAVAAALTGQIFIPKPETVQLELPSSVAEEIPDGLCPTITTLWRLGDPPLEARAQPGAKVGELPRVVRECRTPQ